MRVCNGLVFALCFISQPRMWLLRLLRKSDVLWVATLYVWINCFLLLWLVKVSCWGGDLYRWLSNPSLTIFFYNLAAIRHLCNIDPFYNSVYWLPSQVHFTMVAHLTMHPRYVLFRAMKLRSQIKSVFVPRRVLPLWNHFPWKDVSDWWLWWWRMLRLWIPFTTSFFDEA